MNPSFVGQNKNLNGKRCFLTQQNGDSENTYFLNLLGPEGDLLSSIEFSRPKEWFPVDAVTLGERIALFYNQIDRQNRSSSAGALIIDPGEEEIVDELIYGSQFIGDWNGNDKKGATLQTFEKALESFRDPSLSVPFDFKYFLAHSPLDNQHLLYRYDYSRDELFLKIKWLNDDLEVINEKELMIDEGRVNVAIYVNNKAELFVLNTDALGLLELVRFDSSLQDFDFLQVPPGHTMRDDFMFKFLDDDNVFVASKVDYEGELEGLFYAKFNFKEGDVDKIHFFQIEDELKESVDSLNEAVYGEGVDWDEFHLVIFESYNEEELLLGIEEVHIESSGKKYYPWQIDAPSEFQVHKSVMLDGMIGLFSFNIYDENRWLYWIPKKGKSDINNFAYLPNFQTNFSGGDRIDFFLRNQEKSSELRKANFDYYYALEPSEKTLEAPQKNSSYFPGLMFSTKSGKLMMPFESKDGSTGVSEIRD